MVKTYGSLNERFPILDVVVKHLSCADTEKNLLKELFVTVYGVGYGDGQADAVNKPPLVNKPSLVNKPRS